jgi:hypothetical protein
MHTREEQSKFSKVVERYCNQCVVVVVVVGGGGGGGGVVVVVLMNFS